MTRIEKYKDYRLEIENENNAINVLSSLAKQTKEYQKKINKLNPKILENLLPTEDKYIDTVIINKEFPYKNELEELINEFKNDEAEKFTNEIEYLKNTLDNSKIIFDDGTISENWLFSDENYLILIKIKNILFEIEKKINTNNCTNKKNVPKLIRNNDVTNCFKKIINIENFKINSKFSYRTVYLIILLLLILTIFSLIIATILIL